MSQTTTEKPVRGPLNGVDTPALFATINAVAGQRELADFRFRATNRWESGTHSKTSITSFYGAGSEHDHVREFVIDADHPAVLVGEDNGPLPVELVLAGLASCLTGGIGNIAAARGVTLTEVEATVEGQIDLQGILGLSDEVRNGYQTITVDFQIKGDAPEEKLREIVQQSKARSAVFDIITNQAPVVLTVNGS
ncbi:MAG: putative OsmC-like protein [Myxococcota bacterium]|jgi:uncharacterized OsmC-like protein